jgi:hypothetical protein
MPARLGHHMPGADLALRQAADAEERDRLVVTHPMR